MFSNSWHSTEDLVEDSDIRTSVMMTLNAASKMDYEDLIIKVSDDLQIDSADVRRVVDQGLEEKALRKEGSCVLRNFRLL